jgi:hypothetical protein
VIGHRLRISALAFLATYVLLELFESGFDFPSCPVILDNLAVTNHLNFCMMAITLTWIYADRLKANPERRHKVKGRTGFAPNTFSA